MTKENVYHEQLSPLVHQIIDICNDARLMDEPDVRDAQTWVLQGKTKAKRRIEVTGELKVMTEQYIRNRKGKKVSPTK